mmetsp:Transcript_48567/g.94938  ORF Transcript_48567/g.94938 Transcript_48567/m.94938 type:complete len:215 (+) Transcript_48567:795-1439(+)
MACAAYPANMYAPSSEPYRHEVAAGDIISSDGSAPSSLFPRPSHSPSPRRSGVATAATTAATAKRAKLKSAASIPEPSSTTILMTACCVPHITATRFRNTREMAWDDIPESALATSPSEGTGAPASASGGRCAGASGSGTIPPSPAVERRGSDGSHSSGAPVRYNGLAGARTRERLRITPGGGNSWRGTPEGRKQAHGAERRKGRRRRDGIALG